MLRSEVPWVSFQTAGIISKEQLELIYTLDKQDIAVQTAFFHNKGTKMVNLFVDILTGINKDEVISYTLAMLGEITEADSSCAQYFTALLSETEARQRHSALVSVCEKRRIVPCVQGVLDPMAPLLKLLGRSSMFIVEKAATVLAKVLASPLPVGAPAAVEEGYRHTNFKFGLNACSPTATSFPP